MRKNKGVRNNVKDIKQGKYESNSAKTEYLHVDIKVKMFKPNPA